MLSDPVSIERILTATVLASLAIAIAFGPELRRVLIRVRSRRTPELSADSTSLGVEPQKT